MRFRKNIWNIINVILWLIVGISNLILGVDKTSYFYVWVLLMLHLIADCFREK